MSDKQNHILLAEDDDNLGFVLKEFLEINGYSVFLAPDGKQALDAYNQQRFNICILDVMMPEMDGFTVAGQIRKKDPMLPLVFLTARHQKEDMVKGYLTGADDYITKPFNSEELLLKLNAILRRCRQYSTDPESVVYEVGEYNFNYNFRKLSLREECRKLSSRESELLRLLCENKNKLVKRQMALLRIWGNDDYFAARSMDVYITRLRKFLKQDESVELLNIHGEGFKLVC